ncbi:thiamin pyrophosphokinase 1-like [Physella acuta]|uniref:thiamin pyrophosphokinase 1-like n=1 Tax=Physella acuta TaxID=109671 RepID=UPI0027DE0541|nr:thiamin pyrophosphokinase 1-like [Physella acuta]
MHVFRPLTCLLPGAGPKIALIILNRPIDVPLLTHLWKKSAFTAVTDGGVNRLHKSFCDQKDEYLPNVITGDFDSASPAVLEYYKNKNVDIISTPDQDETDFTKCLRVVTERVDQKTIEMVVAIGAFGGRMDHTLANINTLYTAFSLAQVPLLLLSDSSLALLLDKGEHTLHCDTGLEGDWCGLVPIGQPALNVTTTGLKYNLTNDKMSFGELISTSNTLADSIVTVTTDQPLLWLMGYKDL